MKVISRTILLSFSVIGLSISDASSTDDVEKNSPTIEFSKSKPSTTQLSATANSSTSTSKLTIAAESLPGDNASFETIRKQGKVYVDKIGTLEYLLRDDGNKLFPIREEFIRQNDEKFFSGRRLILIRRPANL
jgi:hypothetical protein